MTPCHRPDPPNRVSRRDALIRWIPGAIAAAATSNSISHADTPASTPPSPARAGREFILFTKPFQSLSYPALANLAVRTGYTGLEFPVRPGGHVQPEAVEEELPQAVEAFRKHGLTIPLIATGINEVSDTQHTEKVLRTAAALGIPSFRMAYYRYDLRLPIATQLKSFAPRLDDLVSLAAEIGIKPLYQNHSGLAYVGAPIWDVFHLLENHSPQSVGLAFDIGHAIVEGTKCWPIQLNLVRKFLDVAYIKDPTWDPDRRQFTWAPLGTGQIPPRYYESLAQAGFGGPFSIHVEYLDHRDPANHHRFETAFRRDLVSLKSALSLEHGPDA